MRILVTGSAGHLGEGLMRVLRETPEQDAVGLDVRPSPFTTVVGSICDRDVVQRCLRGVDAVAHTAALHKPHIGSHTREAFVQATVQGTLVLLEEAISAGVDRFVMTSSTSAFGRALTPPPGAPAAWITEDVTPAPRNIYGVTKTAAEDLCEIVHRERGLACVVLRTSRFFPEVDDRRADATPDADLNHKVNELLYRRVDLEDAVSAHLAALACAPELGFDRLVVSATTPFTPGDLAALTDNAAAVVDERFPDCRRLYAERGWTLPRNIDRVYVNTHAREQLGWRPRFDFAAALDRLRDGHDPRSDLALSVGSKGYHTAPFQAL